MKIRRVDFYPDDWLVGTAMLDDAECGLYIRACALIYSNGGPVEIEHLKAVSRSHGHTFKRCLNRLQTLGKLIVNDSQIDNKRCENELQRAANRLQNLSKSSKNNGLEGTARAQAYARAQVPINIQHTTNNMSVTRVREAPRYTQAFEKFWSVYPNRVGKGAAGKAFEKAAKKTDLDTMLAALERYRRDKPTDREWCNPATWLNQERWLDESEPSNGLFTEQDSPEREQQRRDALARLHAGMAEQRTSPGATRTSNHSQGN